MMCLGIPAKIIEMSQDCPLMRPAKVDFGGLTKTISLSLTPDAQIGDFVLVHVGFAISIIDQNQADSLIQLLNQELQDEVPC